MLRSLRRRLTLICAGGALVILCIMAVISLYTSAVRISQQEAQRFQNHANSIAYRLQTDPVTDWSWLDSTEIESALIVHIEENGMPFLYSGAWQPAQSRDTLVAMAQALLQDERNPDRLELRRRPESGLVSPSLMLRETLMGEEYDIAGVVVRTETGYKSLTLLRSTREERDSILALCFTFGGIVLGCGLLLGWFSWWFSGRAIRPIAESRQRQSEFVAAASHELRTPLTVIRTSVEALRYGVVDPGSLRFADAIERECVRTSRMVDDLLMLANVDAKSWTVRLAPVEVEELLGETVDSLTSMAEQAGVRLLLELPRQAMPLVAGDAQRLEQVLTILVDNALRYSQPGGVVELTCRREGRHAVIVVRDHGPGIPDAYKEKVFERFFRVEADRSKKEHYGLGLPIAWEIVRLHKGRLTLEDTPGGGLTAILRLPCSAALRMGPLGLG